MAYELSWTWDPNRVNGAGAVAKDKATWVLWYIHAVLTNQVGGLSSGAWTVAFSSDGTTASAADNIGAGTYNSAKWTRATAGSPHSYFVIKAPTQDNGSDVFLTFDYSGSADTNVNIWMGRGTLSGGTTSAKPTFTSEVQIGTNVSVTDATTVAHHASCGLASTGQFWIYSSKDASARMAFGLCAGFTTDNDSGDANKFFVSVSFQTSNNEWIGANTAGLNFGTGTAGGAGCWSDANVATAGFAPQLPSYFSTAVGAAAISGLDPKTDGTFLMSPIWIAGGTTTTNIRPKGRIADFFLCGSARTPGQTAPVSSIQYFAIPGMWWPSNFSPSL